MRQLLNKQFGACLILFALAPLGCESTNISDSDVMAVTEIGLRAALEEKNTVLVDVRKEDQYAAGHLPNAINIYLPKIRANNPKLQAASKIIVYGNDWTDPLPIAGAKRLLALEYKNVYQYRGGVEEWKEKGLPIHGNDGAMRPEGDK